MFGFVQNSPFYLRFIHSFGTCQIHQVEFAHEPHPFFDIVSIKVDGKNTVGTSRGLIQRGWADLTDEIAHHEQVQTLLFVLDVNYVDVFESYVMRIVIR